MNYLSVENLGQRIGERLLFQNLQFGLAKGDKVALVARNGMGKTTLLKVLAGKEEAQQGKLTWRNNLRVGFLPQEPDLPGHLTVAEVLFISDSPLMQAVRAYEEALHKAEQDAGPEAAQELQNAMARMDQENAWDYEAKISVILQKLQVNFLDRKIDHLSGGQKKRLALAQVLMSEPDVLLLDEPTNHLDIEMVEWLEEYLEEPSRTVLLVTHDRFFLDRVCTRILEIDNHQLFSYEGNYSYYLEKKAERMLQMQTEVDRAKNRMRTELEWVRRMPKARGTKSKSRLDNFEDIKQKASVKFENKELELKLKMQRQGSKIVELHKVVKEFGDLKILDKFNYVFKQGDRIGVVGPNGVGKSTFLKVLMGEMPVEGGKVVVGETTVFGHYRQDGVQFKPEQRMIELIQELSEAIEMASGETLSASQFLEYFQFPRHQHYTRIADLSGGERRRLHLITVLMRNPNFLILDEPTNDLDLHTLQALEEFLDTYPGVLLVVSHDRFLLDRLTDHLFVLEGEGQVRDFNGSYQEYRIQRTEEEEARRQRERAAQAAPKPEAAPAKAQNSGEKRRLSFKEQREYQQLTEDLDKLEARKAELTAQLGNPPSDYSQLQKISQELETVVQDLDVKTDRWLELADLAEA